MSVEQCESENTDKTQLKIQCIPLASCQILKIDRIS